MDLHTEKESHCDQADFHTCTCRSVINAQVRGLYLCCMWYTKLCSSVLWQTIIDTWSLLLLVPDDCRLYSRHHQENHHCCNCNCNSHHCQRRLYTDTTVITWPLPNKTLVYLCSQNTQHHLPHSPAARLATNWGSSRLQSQDGSSAQYGTVLTGLLNGFLQAPMQPLEMCTYNLVSGLYYATSCYILHSTTTYGPILHKVVSDCSTFIEALNLTPGDIYCGGVHWSDHHQPWGSCASKRGIKVGTWQYCVK